jgi:hypothetical protein
MAVKVSLSMNREFRASDADVVKDRGGRTVLSIDDPALDKFPMGVGVVEFGPQADGPVVLLFHVQPDLDFATHFHNTEQCFVVLEGQIQIGRTWYGPGSIRVQDSGSVYGPIRSGPEGFKAVAFYADRSAIPDQYVREADRLRASELTAEWKATLGGRASATTAPMSGP